jgi:RimJ/RimL family protein N-acetyltransferase
VSPKGVKQLPVIELRLVQAEDAEALFPLIFRTGVADTLLWDGPGSLEEFQKALAERAGQAARGEIHNFTIIEAATVRPIGSASIRPDGQHFRADMGLWIGKPFQGRGYGTQVVRRLIEYGFERLRLEKIDADVFVGNWASRRIFEKNGFSLEGTIRKAVRKYGRAVDEWVLGITRQDYLELPEVNSK